MSCLVSWNGHRNSQLFYSLTNSVTVEIKKMEMHMIKRSCWSVEWDKHRNKITRFSIKEEKRWKFGFHVCVISLAETTDSLHPGISPIIVILLWTDVCTTSQWRYVPTDRNYYLNLVTMMSGVPPYVCLCVCLYVCMSVRPCSGLTAQQSTNCMPISTCWLPRDEMISNRIWNTLRTNIRRAHTHKVRFGSG